MSKWSHWEHGIISGTICAQQWPIVITYCHDAQQLVHLDPGSFIMQRKKDSQIILIEFYVQMYNSWRLALNRMVY